MGARRQEAGLVITRRCTILVLSRRKSDVILIGLEGELETKEAIVVKVLDVRGGDVRIGIEAPERYKILRQEIILRTGGQPCDVRSGKSKGSSKRG